MQQASTVFIKNEDYFGFYFKTVTMTGHASTRHYHLGIPQSLGQVSIMVDHCE
jgi:hypothetical protein